MSKRQSVLAAVAAPTTPIHFVSGGPGTGPAVLADAVAVAGSFPVTIGGDSVIHPRARLDARGGPINIGRRCIVEERAAVGGSISASATATAPAPADPPEGSVTLGDYVSVESGAAVEAGAAVGQGSVVGTCSQVGRGANIGRYCTLAPRTVIPPGTRIPDYTVVYGNGQRRHDGRTAAAETRHRQQARKIEVLRKLIASVPEKYMVAKS